MTKREQLQEELIKHYEEFVRVLSVSAILKHGEEAKEFVEIRNVLMKQLASLKSEQSESDPVYKHNIGSTTQFNVEPQPEVKESQSAKKWLQSKYPYMKNQEQYHREQRRTNKEVINLKRQVIWT